MTTSDRDPMVLPHGLPVPVDDGGADLLTGRSIPTLKFRSTSGEVVDLAELAATALVLYIYPKTGRPGEAEIPGWDETPGARGCTPQSCAFRDRQDEFLGLGFSIAGLSAQTTEDQREASERLHLPFPLLADPDRELAKVMGLPTFEIEGMTFYKRLTLVARDGRIEKVFYPVFPPDENAAEVLKWIRSELANPPPGR